MYYVKFKTLVAFGETRWDQTGTTPDLTYATELFDMYRQIYISVQLLKDETVTNTVMLDEQ